MITCPHCGTQNPDHYTQCPNCGNPLVQAQPQPQPAAYIPPAAQQQPMGEITSTGLWFGWYLLMCVLPIIGTIIMLCASKDPSAKNYAKLMLILQCIGIAFYVLLIILGVASGMTGSRTINF